MQALRPWRTLLLPLVAFAVACSGGNTPATVTALTVSPADTSIAAGATQQFTAHATYSDRTSKDVTSLVSWVSKDTTVAAFDPTTPGLLTGIANGNTTVSAFLGTKQASATVAVTGTVQTGPNLTSISITPAMVMLGVNKMVTLTATGSYDDGSTMDVTSTATWNSDDTAVATVDNTGMVMGVAAGMATVTATVGSVSASVPVRVGMPTLKAIVIGPDSFHALQVGATQQLKAIGTFDDDSSSDITAQVAWTSSSNTLATVSSSGLVTGVAVGQVTVTASLQNEAGQTIQGMLGFNVTAAPMLTALAVSPSTAMLTVGATQAFKATGTYGSGTGATTMDVSSQVTWTSSVDTTVSIDATGTATAEAAGTAIITATLGTQKATAAVTVKNAAVTLTSLTVSPATASVTINGTTQLTAQGKYSDNSTAAVTTGVTWTSSDMTIAMVDNTGLVMGMKAGTATITAAVGSVTSTNMATITVKDASVTLTALAVSPATASVAVGATTQLSAQGTYSDSSMSAVTTGVTWTSSDTTVATVDSTGLVKGVKAGTVTVTAAVGSVTSSNMATITVTAGGSGMCTAAQHPVINEVQLGDTNNANNKFIEIYNPCGSSYDVTGWKLVYRSAAGTTDTTVVSFTQAMTANQFVVAGYVPTTGTGYTGQSDYTFKSSVLSKTGGGLALVDANGSQIDSMGYGTATDAYVNGTAATYPGQAAMPTSVALKADGTRSSPPNDSQDFAVTTTPTPGAANKISP